MQRVCRAHGCALAAAALQFPVAHPCVACVIPGARSVSTPAAPLLTQAPRPTDKNASHHRDLCGSGVRGARCCVDRRGAVLTPDSAESIGQPQ
jgi:hypothetical protein